jgi:HSP20 family protein
MADTQLLTPVTAYDFLGQPLAHLLRWPFAPLFDTAKRFPMRIEEFADHGELVIRAELPGVDPDKDVEIVVENGMLTIRGERRSQTESEQEGQRFSEIQYGSFERTIPLPDGTGEKDVTAAYHEGILEVRLPLGKVAPSKPVTRIPVKH